VSSDLTTNRYDNLIRRVGNMQGPGSKLSELVPAGMPIFPLEGGPHELQAIGGKSTYFAGVGFVPTPGMAAHVQLRNPADSGKLVTISRMDIVSQSQSLLRIIMVVGEAFLDLVSVGFAQRDSRIDSGRSAILETADASIVAGGENYETQLMTPPLVLGWTLAPASLIFVEQTVATVRLTVNFAWSERRLEPSELSF